MASHEFSTEVTAEVEVEVDITVSDEHGNDIYCEVEGCGTDLTVTIDLKAEIEAAKEDLKEEFKQQIVDDIAHSDDLSSLVEFIELIRVSERIFINKHDEQAAKASDQKEMKLVEDKVHLDNLRHRLVNDGLKKDKQIVLLTEQIVNLGATPIKETV